MDGARGRGQEGWWVGATGGSLWLALSVKTVCLNNSWCSHQLRFHINSYTSFLARNYCSSKIPHACNIKYNIYLSLFPDYIFYFLPTTNDYNFHSRLDGRLKYKIKCDQEPVCPPTWKFSAGVWQGCWGYFVVQWPEGAIGWSGTVRPDLDRIFFAKEETETESIFLWGKNMISQRGNIYLYLRNR